MFNDGNAKPEVGAKRVPLLLTVTLVYIDPLSDLNTEQNLKKITKKTFVSILIKWSV